MDSSRRHGASIAPIFITVRVLQMSDFSLSVRGAVRGVVCGVVRVVRDGSMLVSNALWCMCWTCSVLNVVPIS